MSNHPVNNKISTSLNKLSELPLTVTDEVAFHLTDCSSELHTLSEVLSNIEHKSDEEVYSSILEFLIHAPEHIARASELITGSRVEFIFSDKKEANKPIKNGLA